MKSVLFVLLLFIGCKSSNKRGYLIQGNWYFNDLSNAYIKIRQGQWTVQNDSPYPEDYKIIGDTIIVKGFEGSYGDSLEIVKVTEDTLILKEKNDTLKLFKK